MWVNVIRHFDDFLREIQLHPNQCADAEAKAKRVAKSLFAKYYPDQEFDSACYLIGGSYGKGTAAKPRTDVDLNFILPYRDFTRIDALSGNKQSQLLQEVKYILLDTYPNTDIRGDGPVVKVPFQSYYFEVCPVFRCDDGSFLTAHTKNGGCWKYAYPSLESQWIRNIDAATLGKGTHLVKMLKAWKRQCNVDIKSISLEVAAVYFVERWVFRDKTIYYYDWMIRDFFEFLLNYQFGGWAKPPGNGAEQILFGERWQTKCQSAYQRALKACEYERSDEGFLACSEWQKIFGTQFPTDLGSFLSPPSPGLGLCHY